MQQIAKKLYLAKQIRAIDQLAIEQQGIAGIELMRRAGRAVFDVCQRLYPAASMVVFCGAGNNAGDGYVVAKLALQLGLNVTVIHLAQPDSLRGDAFIASQDYLKIGGQLTPFKPALELTEVVIIDALLGIGLKREVSGDYAAAIALINGSGCPVIAVDLPSGLNADTGKVLECAVKATATVCLVGLKQGMVTGMAAEYCGEITVATLAIPERVLQQVAYSATLMHGFHLPKRARHSHKGNYGHVLLVGGDVGYSGAIRLAAEASLRIGAGLVSIATRPQHAAFINAGRPELMCHGVETELALEPLLNRASVIVIGPGLGQTQWAKNLFKRLMQSDQPLVIDADALNLLAAQPLVNRNWVLTPHPGEAARLLKVTTASIENNRFAAVSALSKAYGGVAVLKGAGTLIDNGVETVVATSGNPGMATGGMGDVLTGMIAGLVAQGLGLAKAAAAAVYLHGKAADLSAQQKGEIGLLASDLMPYIRKLING